MTRILSARMPLRHRLRGQRSWLDERRAYDDAPQQHDPPEPG